MDPIIGFFGALGLLATVKRGKKHFSKSTTNRSLLSESLSKTKFKNPTALYVMKAGDATKVGISKSPEKRRKQLQTGNSNPVKIEKIVWFENEPQARKIEKRIHRYLKKEDKHCKGEWFDIEWKEMEILLKNLDLI